MNNSTLVPYNSASASCSSLVSTMFTSVLAVISSVAFIGNILVATIFVKTPSLRTSTNYYIVNMAVSDLLGPLLSWPLYASEGMLTPNIFIHEPWASVACKLGMYIRAVSQIVSVLSLVLIALDRFVAIVFPLKVDMMSVKIRVIFLSLSWLIPILYVLPYALFAKLTKSVIEGQTLCRVMASDKTLTVVHATGITLFYFIPLITNIVLYYMIMRTLKKRPKQTFLQPNHESRTQLNQKVLKILLSIVTAFFVCWTPLCIYLFLRKFYPAFFPNDKCLIIAGFTFYVFPSLSTAVNPVILFTFSTNYKDAFKNLCSQIFSLCKRGFNASQRNIQPNTQEITQTKV